MAKVFHLNSSSISFRSNIRFELGVVFTLIIYAYTFSDRVAIDLGASGFTDNFYDFNLFEITSMLVFAPIVEELICRGHLTKCEKHYWFMLVPTAILGVVLDNQVIWVFCLLTCITIAIFSLKLFPKFKNTLFLILFFITATMFSLLHAPLIDSGSISTDYGIALMAYVPGSIYLGYLRFRYGISHSVVFHSFLNATTLFLNGLFY